MQGIRKPDIAVVLLWTCMVSFMAQPAIADPSPAVALSWVDLPGAEGCGGAPALAKELEGWLGRHALVSPSQADLSIEGRAERSIESGGWRATVELRDVRGLVLGTRELTSDAPDCGPLRDSAALAIVLMIDPNAALFPVPPVAAAQRRVVVAPTETAALASARAAAPWKIASSVDAVLGFGMLPAPAAGVMVDVGASVGGFWAVEMFGRDYVSQRRLVAGGASVHLASTSGGLAICPLHLESARRLVLDLCAGGELAAIESESDGFSVARSNTVMVLRLLARTQVSLRLGGPFGVRAGGELGIALVRDDFVYEDLTGATRDLFNPALIAASIDVGLLLSLP
jgi:hypothetical protein